MICQNSKIAFLVLIGIPGSGKTTWCKTFLRESKFYGSYNIVCISYDKLIPHNVYENDTGQNMTWKEYRVKVLNNIEAILQYVKGTNHTCPEEFMEQMKDWIKGKSTIFVLDDNMYYRSMRYQIFLIAKQYKLGFCQLYFNCSLEKALEMNTHRSGNEQIPPHVISIMQQKIEKPNKKNFWERYSLTFNPYNIDTEFNQLLDKVINECLDGIPQSSNDNESFEEKEQKKHESSINIVHQTDIVLRQIINTKMKILAQNLNGVLNKKTYSFCLNEKRCEILSNIKQGSIVMPDYIVQELSNNDPNAKTHLKQYLEDYFI